MTSLYECKKVIHVRLRKDVGFKETGNYGFCTINKNSMDALQPCCEILCPLGLKVSEENGKDVYEQFVEDMERAEIVYEEYNGRFFYHGPAVRTDEKGFPTRQDVIRATKVKVQWDNLGLDFVVYPVGDKT